LRIVQYGLCCCEQFWDNIYNESHQEGSAMELGTVGLGRMGGNMAQRLINGGHKIVAFDPSEEARDGVVNSGGEAVASLADLVSRLSSPRAVWVMLPAGEITESAINQLAYLLSPGDTVLDGGNANYKDSIRRATALKEKGLSFIDAAPAAEYGDWPRATA
jgi:6-phosphogluconate dehydrogenase